MTSTAAPKQFAARRSIRLGSPPRPTLPSASNTVCQRPVAGKGSNTSRRSAGAPLRRASPTAVADWSTPSAGIPAAHQVGHQTAWAATQIDGRTVAQRDHRVVESARPRHARPATCAPAADGPDRRRVAPSTVRRSALARTDCPARHTPLRCRANEAAVGCTATSRTTSTSSMVSTSDSSATSVTVIPLSRNARSVTGTGVRARHRDGVQAVGHRRVGAPRAPTSRRRGPCRTRRRSPAARRTLGRAAPR